MGFFYLNVMYFLHIVVVQCRTKGTMVDNHCCTSHSISVTYCIVLSNCFFIMDCPFTIRYCTSFKIAFVYLYIMVCLSNNGEQWSIMTFARFLLSVGA